MRRKQHKPWRALLYLLFLLTLLLTGCGQAAVSTSQSSASGTAQQPLSSAPLSSTPLQISGGPPDTGKPVISAEPSVAEPEVVPTLAGSEATVTGSPQTSAALSPSTTSPNAEDDHISAEPSTGVEQIYIAAQFGAPVNGTGWFPLNADCSANLAALVDISSEALSGYMPVEVSDWIPLVELTLADGSIIGFSKDSDRILLCVTGRYFDCTEAVDFDKLCRTLEHSQLTAVLADLPQLTRLSIDVPDLPSRNRDISLTADESQFIWNTLQPDAWEIPDMYTAQDLSRGWDDFVALYRGEVRIALVTQGDIQGINQTVTFYQIDGAENQTAYIFAPEDGYRTLFEWAQNQ